MSQPIIETVVLVAGIVGVGIIAGLISGLVNHLLTNSREGISKMAVFTGAVASIIGQVEQSQRSNLPDLLRSSIPNVKGQCAEVERHISLLKRRQFAAARDKFCALKRGDLMDREKENQRTAKNDTSAPDFEPGRKIMKGLLEELIQCAR